ncbi:MAG: Crp/Fnr family transcriptional regulator [Bacillota bacterium]
MDKNIFKNIQLFNNIDKKDIKKVLNCLKAYEKNYSKKEYIINPGDNIEIIGVVLEGQVNIIKETISGNEIVIANINKYGIFGESYAVLNKDNFPLSVKAIKPTKILFLEYQKLISTCHNQCCFHKKLIDNLLKLLAKKNMRLNTRINCVTKKNIKEKLLFYLIEEMNLIEKKTIQIPFNRKELSNYLATNRSSLSRVLSNLKKNKVIDYHKNSFKLLNLENLKKEINY